MDDHEHSRSESLEQASVDFILQSRDGGGDSGVGIVSDKPTAVID
jgi:hypothetical protein